MQKNFGDSCACECFSEGYAHVCNHKRTIAASEQKELPLICGCEQEEAFATFKESPKSAYTLGYYDPDSPVFVADAIPVVLGARFEQKLQNCQRVISRGNHAMTDIESTFSD
jgi:hypothetical protein